MCVENVEMFSTRFKGGVLVSVHPCKQLRLSRLSIPRFLETTPTHQHIILTSKRRP